MIVTLLVLCLIMAFYLSGLESALMMVNRVHVRYSAEAGDARAQRLYALLARRNDLFHAATSLCHVFSLASFGLAALSLIHVVGNWGWAVAVLLALPIFLLGFELIPKLLFKRHAYSILKRSLTLLGVLQSLSTPLLWLAHRVWPSLLKLPVENPRQLGVEPLVDLIQEQNLLRPETREMLNNLSQVHPLYAAQVMIPLSRLNALPVDLSLVNAMVMTSQSDHYWRVIMDGEGELLGWLDVLEIPAEPDSDSVARHYMKSFTSCSHQDDILSVLKLLRAKAQPIAAVKSDQGEVLGVISIDTIQKALFELT